MGATVLDAVDDDRVVGRRTLAVERTAEILGVVDPFVGSERGGRHEEKSSEELATEVTENSEKDLYYLKIICFKFSLLRSLSVISVPSVASFDFRFREGGRLGAARAARGSGGPGVRGARRPARQRRRSRRPPPRAIRSRPVSPGRGRRAGPGVDATNCGGVRVGAQASSSADESSSSASRNCRATRSRWWWTSARWSRSLRITSTPARFTPRSRW